MSSTCLSLPQQFGFGLNCIFYVKDPCLSHHPRFFFLKQIYLKRFSSPTCRYSIFDIENVRLFVCYCKRNRDVQQMEPEVKKIFDFRLRQELHVESISWSDQAAFLVSVETRQRTVRVRNAEIIRSFISSFKVLDEREKISVITVDPRCRKVFWCPSPE